ELTRSPLSTCPVIIKDVCHGGWTPTTPPPPVGQSNDLTFTSGPRAKVSTDGGNTFFDVFLTGQTEVRVTGLQDSSGGDRYFDTDMLALNLQPLAGGILMRACPTLQSLG